MDVTRYNLDDGLLLLERSLTDPKCEFVAFDEEMTSISFGNASFRDFNAARDSPAARYAKMRGVRVVPELDVDDLPDVRN